MNKQNFIYSLLIFLLIFYIIYVNNRLKKMDKRLSRYTEFIEYKVDSLTSVIDSLNIPTNKVIATMYHPTIDQTDDSPNQLADGTYIRTKRASKYNYIAVSRNLLKKNGGQFKMEDLVFVFGAGHKSGIYRIRDKMNKRFKNRIDFLESPNTPNYKYTDVQITKISIKRVKHEKNDG